MLIAVKKYYNHRIRL